MKRILVIGNAAGGKTHLSRRLAEKYELPLFHIDSMQFDSNLRIRPLELIRRELDAVIEQEAWIIDGFGPLDLLDKRLETADRIVFVDLPILRHFFWFLKRQVMSLWAPRIELPKGANELTFSHTIRVARTIWKVHNQMRPEMLRILNRNSLKSKTVFIQTVGQIRDISL